MLAQQAEAPGDEDIRVAAVAAVAAAKNKAALEALPLGTLLCAPNSADKDEPLPPGVIHVLYSSLATVC